MTKADARTAAVPENHLFYLLEFIRIPDEKRLPVRTFRERPGFATHLNEGLALLATVEAHLLSVGAPSDLLCHETSNKPI